MKRASLLIAALLFVLSAGCGDKPDTTSAKSDRRSLTPEQAAMNRCAAEVSMKWAKPKTDASMATLPPGSDNSSDYIEAVLARKRIEDQACLEYARCFQSNGIFFNGMFASCLDAR
jgi:hypothetical protein